MLRTSIYSTFYPTLFLAIATVVTALGAVTVPAAASPSQYSGSRNEQISAHFLSEHERTTVGMSRYRFPGKKKN